MVLQLGIFGIHERHTQATNRLVALTPCGIVLLIVEEEFGERALVNAHKQITHFALKCTEHYGSEVNSSNG